MGASNKSAVECVSYAAGAAGSLAIFPLTMYWTHRGLNQLTFGGETSYEGINPDPSDRYTLIALLLTIPVILGCIGSVTSADSEMFAKLGSASLAIRLMSALIFAVAGSLPGLSSMAKSASTSVFGFFESKFGDRQPLLEDRLHASVNNPQG